MANQNQEFLYRPCFLADLNRMRVFVEAILNFIPAKFGSNWHSSFRREDGNVKSLQMTDRQMAKTHMTLY